jgi:hypothetical protein
MGKSWLAEHVLADRRVLAVNCAELRHVSARDVTAALLRRLDEPPRELVHLLAGGRAGAGSVADELMLLSAAGHRLASEIPRVVPFVDDAELLEDAELMRLSRVMGASELPWLFASRRDLALGLATVKVPPLEDREAHQLVDTLLPQASPELRTAVLERAGDSPLFIEQCARLILENDAGSDGAALFEVPRSMRTFVDERL